jgi:DNA-binding beta-propeller fold protein YncE
MAKANTTLLLILSTVMTLCACALEESGAGFEPSFTNDGRGGEDTGADASQDAPPEEEETFLLAPPAASLNYVYVANTSLNTIARIDSLSLEIVTIDVCLSPTRVAALADRDRAVVLCAADHQLARIDSEPAEDVVAYASVAEHANRVTLSPDGDFALVWYDERLAEPQETPGNPHDLTLVALAQTGDAPVSYRLSVGFAIQSIQFDADSRAAFVTTQDGLSVVPLREIHQDQFLPVLSLGDDPLIDVADREVVVTDDGALAFVRSSQLAGLRVLDLETETLSEIALPAVPTDLDLFPGGDLAIAVLRETSQVAVLPLPGAIDDPGLVTLYDIPDETIGQAQVSGEVTEVLLFSSALPSQHLTVLDVESGDYRTYPLRKEVAGVVMAPTGDRAVIVHRAAPGEPVAGEPTADFIAKSQGYTVFDVQTRFVRLVLSDTEPDQVVFSEDGGQAFVRLEDAERDVRAVQWIHFDSLRIDTLEMSRPPLAMGIVPGTGRVWVSQEAPTGRITFIDTATGEQEHVTAYQLNRRVE